jgi:hypothetical protein
MTMERVSIGALLLTIAIAVAGVVKLSGENLPQINGDFRNAAVAEVRDSQGQTLLRGSFIAAAADDADEVERHAKLEPMVAGVSMAGEAEVEYETAAPAAQEVEFSVTGVTAGAQLTLVIDGTTVATATADSRGRVSVELEVKAAAN